MGGLGSGGRTRIAPAASLAFWVDILHTGRATSPPLQALAVALPGGRPAQPWEAVPPGWVGAEAARAADRLRAPPGLDALMVAVHPHVLAFPQALPLPINGPVGPGGDPGGRRPIQCGPGECRAALVTGRHCFDPMPAHLPRKRRALDPCVTLPRGHPPPPGSPRCAASPPPPSLPPPRGDHLALMRSVVETRRPATPAHYPGEELDEPLDSHWAHGRAPQSGLLWAGASQEGTLGAWATTAAAAAALEAAPLVAGVREDEESG